MYQLNLISLGLNVMSGYLAGLDPLFYPFIMGSNLFLHLIINKFDMNDRESCNRFFKMNKWSGFLVLLSIVAGNYKKESPAKEVKA